MTYTRAIGIACNKVIRLIVHGFALSKIHPNVLTFLGLVINIAAAVLLAAGRPWVHAVVVGTPGQVRISPAARSVAPAVSGLGLFALASVVAVVATRRTGRLIVGALAGG